MGWLICFSEPDWCVDTTSKPWLRSSTTVGNYLLVTSTLGWDVNLSVQETQRSLTAPLWEHQWSGDLTHPTDMYVIGWQGRVLLNLVGLWKKSLLFHAAPRGFQMKFWVLDSPVLDVLLKGCLGAQDFPPVLPVLPDQSLWPDSITFLRFLACIWKDEAFSVMLLLLQLCDEKENAIQNTEAPNPQMQMLLQMNPLPTWREKIQAQIHSLALTLYMRQLTVRPKSNYLCVQKIFNIKFSSAPSNFIFRFLHSLS